MRILIIGQTSLHWGRMEFGNIGNYYIIEPFVRELHRVFPNAEIRTTLQMSDDFCNKEKIVRLPLNLYYSWDDDGYLNYSINELGTAIVISSTNEKPLLTPYIKEVLKSDLVIDFSGDIWGDNADLVGDNRFIIGLIKNRIPQLLGKKTAMLAGSPGPFKKHNNKFTYEVFNHFDLVTNREPISTVYLKENEFDIANVKDLACPAFLFEPESEDNMRYIFDENCMNNYKPKVGFIICGWNLLTGPYDKWPVQDYELDVYVKAIEYLTNELKTNVFLMSHSNGFELPPNFKVTQGRDYPYAKRLYEILEKIGGIDMSQVSLLKGIYNPRETKAIIGKFDMLISGRVHAAVAALSQNIPTVIIDYGHEPKAHKLKGFAKVAEVDEYLVNPSTGSELIDKIHNCWCNRQQIKKHLISRIPIVKKMARQNFELLKKMG